jgi:uncharacterized protein (TIGR02145 family)
LERKTRNHFKKSTLRKSNLLILFLVGMTSAGFAQTVKIGTQIWMTQNIDVDKFRNGDLIPQAKTDEEWQKAANNQQPAWCYYNNETANDKKYGKLYNYYAVIDSRGLAPNGYHIPSDAEWSTLITYLGDNDETGTKMKSTSGWNEDGNGTNSIGFSGMPGGIRYSDGSFLHIGNYGVWWTSSEYASSGAFFHRLNCDTGLATGGEGTKNDGLSVRCIKD